MSFNFSDFKLPGIEREFKPHEAMPDGSGVTVVINPNYMSSERIERINEILEARVNDLQAGETAVDTFEAVAADENDYDGDGDGGTKKASRKTAKRLKPAQTEEITTATTESAEAAETKLVKKQGLTDVFSMEREQIRFRAQILGGVEGDTDPDNRLVTNWDVIADGVPVPVSFESFMKMPLPILNAFYEFCTSEAARPTKKSGKPSGSI